MAASSTPSRRQSRWAASAWAERRIFSVTAAVTLDRTEVDLDHHLVLRKWRAHDDRRGASAALCTVGATPYRRRQMRDARRAARVCARARVAGVAFWDYFHGQTGVAPNGIELHPILGFACLSA